MVEMCKNEVHLKLWSNICDILWGADSFFHLICWHVRRYRPVVSISVILSCDCRVWYCFFCFKLMELLYFADMFIIILWLFDGDDCLHFNTGFPVYPSALNLRYPFLLWQQSWSLVPIFGFFFLSGAHCKFINQ